MGRPRKYASDAERVAAYRERHELVTLSVDLPRDVVEAFEKYLLFKNRTKRDAIEALLVKQLLRKR